MFEPQLWKYTTQKVFLISLYSNTFPCEIDKTLKLNPIILEDFFNNFLLFITKIPINRVELNSSNKFSLKRCNND